MTSGHTPRESTASAGRGGHAHDHDHDHDDHGHDSHAGHGHGHHHAPANWNRAFAIGIGLNIGFVLIEAGYGLYADSLALLADAGHNFSDVLSLVLAWGAAILATRRPSARRTYGLRRSTILASLLSGLMLLLAIGGIAWEAVGRFREPAPVNGTTMMIVAAIGVLVNGATAWLFASGRHSDLNIRAAFLHMAGDAAISVGVVIAGAGVLLLGLPWLDPAVSLLIVLVIAYSTWQLLLESVDLAMDAVPRGIDPAQVERYLRGLPGVSAIHDLHIWGLSTTEVALTAHLVMPGGGASDEFLAAATEGLRRKFRIPHATLQVERADIRHGCDQP